jgi:hypothetical protein
MEIVLLIALIVAILLYLPIYITLRRKEVNDPTVYIPFALACLGGSALFFYCFTSSTITPHYKTIHPNKDRVQVTVTANNQTLDMSDQRLKPFLEKNIEVILTATNSQETAQKGANKIIIKGSGLNLNTLSYGYYNKQTTLFGIPVGAPEKRDHVLEATFKNAKGSIIEGKD